MKLINARFVVWVSLAAAASLAGSSKLASAAAPAGDDEAPLCIQTLRDLCGANSGNTDPCMDCARNNQEALLEDGGCTTQIVQRACKAAAGGDGNTDNGNDSDSDDDDNSNERPPVNDIPVVVPETSLPTGATEENPLRVFLQAGQSGCTGSASVPMMNDDPNYEELQGVQEGVWFAGIKRRYQRSLTDPSLFFIAPMLAGEGSRDNVTMGPEVAIGRRLYDAEGGKAPVMMIKYCWGGSNLKEEWNPDSTFNSWDKEQDDGTAKWLLEETGIGGADLGDKKHLYANLIYTVRRSLELLDEADIPYKLSGMFWLQGAADKKRTWRQYGEDTVAFFEAVRTELNAPSMPIVDEGSVHHNVQTGKAYASSVMDGCNTVLPTMALAAPDPEDTECSPGPSNPCTGTTFINFDIFDYYGYDPGWEIPEFAALKPPGASNKTFYWFKDWPNDQHMQYEGKILQGRMMANSYIRSFTNHELTEEWIRDDSGVQFPYSPCDPSVNNGKPSADNVCWIDEREDEDLAEATCSKSNNLKLISSSNNNNSSRSSVGGDTTSMTMSLSSAVGTTASTSWAMIAHLSAFSAFFFVVLL